MTERLKRTGIMLCYPFEESRLAKWQPPYIVQPKLDGVRCRLLNDGRVCLLLSSTEEIITSVPHINELTPRVLPHGEWDGELYVHGWTFEDINSVVSRTMNLHENHREVQFHCFDVVMQDESQLARSVYLIDVATQHANRTQTYGHIRFVSHYMAHDLEDVMKLRERFMAQGYEGIIVRHCDAPYVRKRSTFMMKFKPKKMDAYEITGVIEERDKYGAPKGTLGALVCRGDDGEEFRVGSGFTADQRRVLWSLRDRLPGQYVKVEYQAMTPGRGVPRFPIFYELISLETANAIELR